jgi:hypothetical protein
MPKFSRIAQSVGLAAALVMSASSIAAAQPYQGQYPRQGEYPPSQDYGPPPGAPPDSVYEEQGPPPPPEGYYGRYDSSEQARSEDEAYRRSAEGWAARNCYRKGDNAAGGAIIGGILGAMIGSSVAGHGNHASGAVVGGAVGAMTGAAIGASSTSPGCPPGYVVREDAPPFYFNGFSGGYGYAAPPGYRPWIWTSGRWVYRPYPYHRYWYRSHWRARRRYGY